MSARRAVVDREQWQIPRGQIVPDYEINWSFSYPHNKLPRARCAGRQYFPSAWDVAKINRRVNSPLFPSHAINRRPFRCLRSGTTHAQKLIHYSIGEHMCVLPVTFCAGAAISISKHLVPDRNKDIGTSHTSDSAGIEVDTLSLTACLHFSHRIYLWRRLYNENRLRAKGAFLYLSRKIALNDLILNILKRNSFFHHIPNNLIKYKAVISHSQI